MGERTEYFGALVSQRKGCETVRPELSFHLPWKQAAGSPGAQSQVAPAHAEHPGAVC